MPGIKLADHYFDSFCDKTSISLLVYDVVSKFAVIISHHKVKDTAILLS